MDNFRIGDKSMSRQIYKDLWYTVCARRGGWFIVWDESRTEAKIVGSYRDVSSAISRAVMEAEFARERGE